MKKIITILGTIAMIGLVATALCIKDITTSPAGTQITFIDNTGYWFENNMGGTR